MVEVIRMLDGKTALIVGGTRLPVDSLWLKLGAHGESKLTVTFRPDDLRVRVERKAVDGEQET